MSKFFDFFANFSWETFAALSALVLSGISLVQTSRFNKRQNDFAETADRLNALLLEKEQNEQKLAQKANLDASVYLFSKSNYRLKIFNQGSGTATNVRAEILQGQSLFSVSDLESKLPFPQLAQHQSLEFILCPTLNSPRRIQMKITWDDATGVDQETERFLSL